MNSSVRTLAFAALLAPRACDYRIPLAQLRGQGSEGHVEGPCGCGHLCTAGRSTKPDRLVSRECYACDLAGPLH